MKKLFGIMMAIAVVGVMLGGCAAEDNTDNTMDNNTIAPAGGGGEGGANSNL